jgi:hypothetical protein
VTVPGYLLAVALLAAFAAPPVIAAHALRGRLLPGWSGAPARLAEAVAAIAIAVLVSEALGAVGLFRAWALVPASVLVGGGLWLLCRRREAVASDDAPPRAPGPRGGVELWLPLGGALLVLGQWAVPARVSFDQGMAAPDTLWYHGPFAARFVQDGWLTRLHFVEVEPLTAFYPANSELLHAIGTALFDSHDVLSPLVNLGMVALALLAGWCIGRPYGVAPLALLGTALALSVEILWGINAGQAGNDATGLAFFLAAAALVANGRGRPLPLAFAGTAAGLALGTKFSLVGPALALSVAAVVALGRHWRPRRSLLASAAWWGLPLLATGGYWYARNLFRTGSPLPTVGFDLGPISYTPPPRPLTEDLEFPVAHYLLDWDIWDSHLLPGFRFGFGPVWWAVVALAAAGAVGALVARGDRPRRVLGLVALACALLYAVTPNSAAGREGDPWSFGLNLRYATPALALGLALLPTWLPRGRELWRRVLLALLASALALTLLSPTGLPSGRRLEALGWAALVAALVAAGWWLGRGPGQSRVAVAAALGTLALAAGFLVQRHYLDHRYTDPSLSGLEFARGLTGTRIGVLGATVHYQLYGNDLSNRVIYIGRRGPHGAFTREPDCRAWRSAVNDGRFRYLVVAPVTSPDLPAETPSEAPVEASWTDGDPAAVPIQRIGDIVTVYRIDGRLDERC